MASARRMLTFSACSSVIRYTRSPIFIAIGVSFFSATIPTRMSSCIFHFFFDGVMRSPSLAATDCSSRSSLCVCARVISWRLICVRSLLDVAFSPCATAMSCSRLLCSRSALCVFARAWVFSIMLRRSMDCMCFLQSVLSTIDILRPSCFTWNAVYYTYARAFCKRNLAQLVYLISTVPDDRNGSSRAIVEAFLSSLTADRPSANLRSPGRLAPPW